MGSSGSSSGSSQGLRQRRLRKKALAAYGHGEHAKVLQCPILMVPLPAAVVSCAHLVPQSLRKQWVELGITEHDTRNVIFLYKGIEEAYDSYLLSFVLTNECDDSGRTLYRVHVWDPELRPLPVVTNVRNRSEHRTFPNVQLPAELTTMTFDMIHGQLRVLSEVDHQPYKRALSLQAMLARSKARVHSWPDLDLPDITSPELSPEKRLYIAQWSAAAAAATASFAAGGAPMVSAMDEITTTDQ